MDNRFEIASPRYAPSWFWRRFVHSRVVQRVFMWTFKRLFGLRVRNRELVPPPWNYIIAANHGSHYDLFLGLAAVYEITGEVAVAAVWDGVFDLPIIGGIVKAIPCVAIDTRIEKDTRRTAAVRELANHLRAGRCIIIACEGERHDQLGEFQHGAAFLSLLTGVPVVPSSLRGVQDLFKDLSWPNRYRGKVEAVLHAPLHPAQFEAVGGTRAEIIERFTRKIREQVAADLDYPLRDADE
ncbi:MAG: 1-acyl-sn-glycerol-3-phosphate acyltransferase [Verrucomicrobia bacterium]|nr:1-acyl-sn-glycerol-3-phosphate acyltransferase [Verrucomicrobiota bacterium]